MRRIAVCLILMIFVNAGLFAGDMASFVNLGFSGNSCYFMFSQYGVSGNEIYSDLFTVDVKKNTYVKNGIIKKRFNQGSDSQEDGTGALYSAIAAVSDFASDKNIDFTKKGRCLYLDINGDSGKAVSFRDFKTGKNYDVELSSNVKGSKESVSSSFGIYLSVIDKNGKKRNYRVGNPSYSRKGISDYKIKRVIISPDEKGLVFVIEKKVEGKGGSSLRYMIETLCF